MRALRVIETGSDMVDQWKSCSLVCWGIRMCPECPHCNCGKNPCQDKFGSNAEAQGGSLGRCDALFRAVETQKSGVLHYHMKAFIQRLHQHPRRSYDDDASAWTPNRRIQLVLLCVAVAHLGNRSYFLCVFPQIIRSRRAKTASTREKRDID